MPLFSHELQLQQGLEQQYYSSEEKAEGTARHNCNRGEGNRREESKEFKQSFTGCPKIFPIFF